MEAGETSGRRILSNTLVNGAGRAVNAAVAIALTPLLLSRLGAAHYGVWLLATTLTFASGYASLADLGLQQAAIRAIAEARSRGDLAAVNATVSTAVSIFWIIGLALAGVFAAASGFLVDAFGVGAALRDDACLVFVLVGVQIAFDLPAAGFLALVEGAQRFSLARAIEIPLRFGWGAGVAIVVLNGGEIVHVAALSVAFAVVGLLLMVIASWRVEPQLSLRPSVVTRGALWSMARQSSTLFGIKITSVVYNQMDRLIIGGVLTVVAVAEYDVVYKIHAVGFLVLGVVSSAVMPAAASLHASGSSERLSTFFIRGTRLAMALSLPVSVSAIVFARPLIGSWVGSRFEHLAGPARLFLVYPVIAVFVSIGEAMLIGVGRAGAVLRFHVGSVVLNFGLSLALAPRLGIKGAIVGTIVASTVVVVPLLAVCLRSFGTSWGAWFWQVVAPNAMSTAAVVGVGSLLLRVVDGTSGFAFVGAAVVSTALVGIVAFLLVGADDADREAIRRAVLRR
ncbi:MAG: hypothetical protein E6Q57_20410 [Mycobacterium sp.]|nr:MAG: hypothetical protein E6Q57_20410 [Mycobacterium sp.]